MQEESEQAEKFTLKSLSRRPGTSGIYDIAIDITEDGSTTAIREALTRRTIAMRAAAMARRSEPHCQRSYEYLSFLLSLFPSLPPDMAALRTFAEQIDFDLTEHGAPVEDAGRAWEMLFSESATVHRDPVYALSPPQ